MLDLIVSVLDHCLSFYFVFIIVLECGHLSVCQRVDVSGLPTVWCEIIGGWDCDKVWATLYNMTRRQSMRL